MERLTINPKNGRTSVGSRYGLVCENNDMANADIFKVIDKLGEYEDTGLTPEEIMEYTGWRFTSQELPLSPTEEQIECRLNEYIVQIEGTAFAATLYYYGENFWADEEGESYAVVAWMPLPKVSSQ